jgi:hypothetical protein
MIMQKNALAERFFLWIGGWREIRQLPQGANASFHPNRRTVLRVASGDTGERIMVVPFTESCARLRANAYPLERLEKRQSSSAVLGAGVPPPVLI